MTRRTEAQEIATALELGLLSVPDAIRWADAGIEADPQPPFALIEVSLAAKAPPVEVAHLLRSLPGEPGRRELARRLVCRIAGALHDGRVTAAWAARILYQMVLAELVPDPSAEGDMARLDDAFDLARGGYFGTVEEAERDLHEFLDRYTR